MKACQAGEFNPLDCEIRLMVVSQWVTTHASRDTWRQFCEWLQTGCLEADDTMVTILMGYPDIQSTPELVLSGSPSQVPVANAVALGPSRPRDVTAARMAYTDGGTFEVSVAEMSDYAPAVEKSTEAVIKVRQVDVERAFKLRQVVVERDCKLADKGMERDFKLADKGIDKAQIEADAVRAKAKIELESERQKQNNEKEMALQQHNHEKEMASQQQNHEKEMAMIKLETIKASTPMRLSEQPRGVTPRHLEHPHGVTPRAMVSVVPASTVANLSEPQWKRQRTQEIEEEWYMKIPPSRLGWKTVASFQQSTGFPDGKMLGEYLDVCGTGTGFQKSGTQKSFAGGALYQLYRCGCNRSKATVTTWYPKVRVVRSQQGGDEVPFFIQLPLKKELYCFHLLNGEQGLPVKVKGNVTRQLFH
jgi:hypothetical protein